MAVLAKLLNIFQAKKQFYFWASQFQLFLNSCDFFFFLIGLTNT